MLYFIVALFKISFFWLSPSNGIRRHVPGDVQTISNANRKSEYLDVLPMCRDKFDRVGWNRFRSHCTTS